MYCWMQVVYVYDSYQIKPKDWQKVLKPSGAFSIRGKPHDGKRTCRLFSDNIVCRRRNTSKVGRSAACLCVWDVCVCVYVVCVCVCSHLTHELYALNLVLSFSDCTGPLGGQSSWGRNSPVWIRRVLYVFRRQYFPWIILVTLAIDVRLCYGV